MVSARLECTGTLLAYSSYELNLLLTNVIERWFDAYTIFLSDYIDKYDKIFDSLFDLLVYKESTRSD